MSIVSIIAFALFVFLLPLLVLLSGLSADEAWLVRVLFPFLAPFSSVIWFIILHRVITHRRSGYRDQSLVFLATSILTFLLIRLGVYRIR